MNSIRDVLTTNLMENLHAVTLFDAAFSSLLSLGVGLFIWWVYRRIYHGSMYSSSFGVSLVAFSMITTTLILAVTSNVVLSLGMVGALSIVRFRTAIKDPLEIMFLFWSIETGIVLATGLYHLAVGVNVAIGCVLLILVKRKPDYPYILVLRCERRTLDSVWPILDEHTTYYEVKSRRAESQPAAVQGSTANGNSDIVVQNLSDSANVPDASTLVELDIEVSIKHPKDGSSPDETEFVDVLAATRGVRRAVLVTYNGSYMN